MIKFLGLAKYGVLGASLFFAGSAYAGCDANGCTATPSDPLKRIYLTSISDGQIYIEPPSGKENLDCTLRENQYLTLRSSHPLFKETYSALLAGATANNRIYMRIKNGSAICEIAYVMVHF